MIWNLFILFTIIVIEFSLPNSLGIFTHVLLVIAVIWLLKDIIKNKASFKKRIT